ncbi:glycosyltransferase family 4 protein [Balneola sp. MJW-20]|uniref:glycosyltransferase family 4 protein n=1 Tax=Gracilimonas aurantiaca TaxID=3234185 RepID=UPI0034658BB2
MLNHENTTVRKILIFVDWFKPGYKAGGPIRSVANLIDHLHDEFEFDVVTSDRDQGDSGPYESIEINEWIQFDHCRVWYLSPDQQTIRHCREIIEQGDYDRIYINSMLSLNFALKPLMALRNRLQDVILAPRGMLGKGALSLKPVKKKLFLWLFRMLGVGKKITWHATSPDEVAEIQEQFGETIKFHTVRNLPSVMPEQCPEKNKEPGDLKLFFLSRISSIKNLSAALEYLAMMDSICTIRFTIFGPLEEPSYWQECCRLIEKLPDHIHVEYRGTLPHPEIEEQINDQHLMILPTLNENYGHVIVEAWQNACPVIISDNTPWKNLEEKSVGFDISLDQPERFVKGIEKMAGMDQKEFERWSNAAFEYGRSITYDEEVLNIYRKMFMVDKKL